ncbi:alpha-2,8-polysialyltransferase family protein [Spirillospora sp. NPDC047279]|uniref:alpha-2,8-polysialyltransferase family protein n=1 Tax=Spirillospora sp. NPDC047279 TaxID=3155478 RepID=UPI00340A92AD
MTTQLFVTSTLFSAVTLAAAIDAGAFGPRDRRRVLLVSNNSAVPEASTPVDRVPGFATLAWRFDDVLSWNDELAPLHPSGWEPRMEDLPLWERIFRDRWGLGADPVELVTESIAVPPARSLASIFFDAAVTVYSDGLMSYGPTRNALPYGIGTQITRQLHLDLVPGLEPQLLREYEVPAEIIPDEPFRTVLDKFHAEVAPTIAAYGADLDGAPLVIGQYLAALGILGDHEEDELHATMVRGAAARGHETVLFKPHPGSPVRATERLAAEAGRLGIRLLVVDAPVPAETWFAATRPALVVGCFSTALVTAARYYGLPAAAVGTELLLERLKPYENSNRVPVTIVDTTIPRLGEDGTLHDPRIGPDAVQDELVPLVAAISYCMRASARPDLRAAAAGYLEAHQDDDLTRHFKRRRLTSLDLPGGVAQGHPRVLGTVLPRSSRRRQLAIAALRRAEQLRARPK